MNKEVLLAKKAELEAELDELEHRKWLSSDDEARIHNIKKMKLRIKDMLNENRHSYQN